jgi:hypothetical protein
MESAEKVSDLGLNFYQTYYAYTDSVEEPPGHHGQIYVRSSGVVITQRKSDGEDLSLANRCRIGEFLD